MPEYWFKYGATEVSVEVPEDVEHEVLGAGEPRLPRLEEVRALAEEMAREAGESRPILIVYDHVGEGAAAEALRAVVAELEALGVSDRLRILPTAWRLDPRVGGLEADRAARRLGKTLKPGEVEMVELTRGLRAAKPLKEAGSRLIISSAEPHGVYGAVGLREALLLGGAVEFEEELGLSEAWERVLEELPCLGVCAVGPELFRGEAGVADGLGREAVAREFAAELGERVEVALAGAGGWPRDASLESSAHILRLLSEAVVEGGLIGLIAECSRGLGSKGFVEALAGVGGRGLQAAVAGLLKEVLGPRRVALVSALPKAVAEKLLGVRSFDSPQELLTYGLRLYSKRARVLIAPTGLRVFRTRGGRS